MKINDTVAVRLHRLPQAVLSSVTRPADARNGCPAQPQPANSLLMPRLLGAAGAGIMEVGLFHPVDTASKRLMVHQQRCILTTNGVALNVAATRTRLRAVVFPSSASGNMWARGADLFPGLGWAASYKTLQRLIKFGTQPIVADAVERHASERHMPRPVMEGLAGALAGVAELVILPLDNLKVKKQTNPAALRATNLAVLLRKDTVALYRGWTCTGARNAVGSFGLFGMSALVKERCFGVDTNADRHNTATVKLTLGQRLASASAGAVACIILSSPFDVLKTRCQKRDFSVQCNLRSELRGLLASEGVSALFKGLTPKLLTAGPKIVFSFTLADMLMRKLAER